MKQPLQIYLPGLFYILLINRIRTGVICNDRISV